MGISVNSVTFSSIREMREYLGISKTIAEVTSIMPDDHARAWFQRLEALDNLLLLYGLQRQETVHGGGFVVFHKAAPNVSRWIDLNESEESWVENVKLLAR